MNRKEAILIRRVREGDKQAFREIYDLYRYRVYSFASRYLSNDSAIEEVIQEIFVKLWETRARIREDLPFHNYLFTITRNTILHGRQKEMNRQKYMEYHRIYISMKSLSTQNTIEYNEVNKILNAAVGKLPPKRQQIFLLNREEGLSYKMIAGKLGISLKTVEAHMRLALQDLRADLEEFL